GSSGGMLNILGTHDTARLMTEFRRDEELVKAAFTGLFTLPGAPLVYYGDEVGMEGENDPDCRRAFPWEESEWNESLRTHIQRLADVRSRYACLRHGTFTPVFGNDRVASYVREFDGEVSLVILNGTELPR